VKVKNLKSEVRSSNRSRGGAGKASPLPLADDRGVATLEGLLVSILLTGVLLGVMLLGQWGTHLQYAQMGARLLAFNAGDVSLAKFGRAGDSATKSFSTGGWGSSSPALSADWLNMMFVLPNDRYAGRVTGTQRGRLAGQGGSLFDFSRASVGYFAHSSAASNPWSDSPSAVRLKFLGIVYYVGFNRTSPQGLGSVPSIPTSIPLVESIYARVGGVR
jgi:hypothetical protein